MHIASGLTLVRRAQAQSAIAIERPRRLLRFARIRKAEQVEATRSWVRKILPGAILLTILALIGALFPMLF